MRGRPRGRRARPTNSSSIGERRDEPGGAEGAGRPSCSRRCAAIAADRGRDVAGRGRGDVPGSRRSTCPTPSVAVTVMVWFAVDPGQIPLVGRPLLAVAVRPCGATVIVTCDRSQSSCASTFTEKSWPIRCRLSPGDRNVTVGAAVSLMQPNADGFGPPPQAPRRRHHHLVRVLGLRSQRSPVTGVA